LACYWRFRTSSQTCPPLDIRLTAPNILPMLQPESAVWDVARNLATYARPVAPPALGSWRGRGRSVRGGRGWCGVLRRTSQKFLGYGLKNYCADSPFTTALEKCICSEEYATTSAIRNVLSHRSSPTRAIHFTNRPVEMPNTWNLDLWFGGKVSKKELSLEPRTLVELHEWLEQQLELLSKELESLAAIRGLR
jgi:hypothetical protein